jgi:hypothetical protein
MILRSVASAHPIAKVESCSSQLIESNERVVKIIIELKLSLKEGSMY